MLNEQVGDLTASTSTEMKPSEDQSGFPKDSDQDLDALGKSLEQGLANETEVLVPTQETEPVAQVTETATQPEGKEEVPDKFKDKDGNLDIEKVEKSTVDAQTALTKYTEMVAAMNKKRHEAHLAGLQSKTGTTPQEPTPSPEQNFDAVAKQIEDELRKNGTGRGLANILSTALENNYQRGRADLSALQEAQSSRDRKETLDSIAASDPWVFQPEGQAAIAKTLEQNPWLENSPDPIQAAYLHYRGLNPLATSSVSPLNPTTPTAPSTPAGGVRNTQQEKPTFDVDKPNELTPALDRMSPEEEDKFWASQNLPPLIRK